MNIEFPSWLDREEDCKNFLVNNCPVSTEIIKRKNETYQLDCQDKRFKLSQINSYKPDIKYLYFLYIWLFIKRKNNSRIWDRIFNISPFRSNAKGI